MEDKEVIDLYEKFGVSLLYRDRTQTTKDLCELHDIVGRAMKTVGITPEPAKN